MEQKSLFERIGGKDAIHAAVDLFYQKQLADPNVKGFFLHIDLEKLKAHQRNFMTKAFGGPDNYTGRNMFDSHKDLYIMNGQFDSVKQNLVDALTELKVSKDLIDEVAAIVETTRGDIVFNPNKK